MSAQEFKSMGEFTSWVRDNINKLWQYNYFTNNFQKRNQGDIINPKLGHIYVEPISETHMNVFFLNHLSETNVSFANHDYVIEYYGSQIGMFEKSGLRITYVSHEADYWDRRLKGKSNVFLYNDSFEFLNWKENPFEVKS